MRSHLPRSLTARTLALSAVSALLLIAGLGVLVAAIGSQRSAGRLALRSQEAITAATQLEKTAVNLDNGVRGFVASTRASALEPFTVGRRDYPLQLQRLRDLTAGDPVEQRLVRRIGIEIDDYIGLWAVPLISVAREHLATARQILIYRRGRDRIESIRQAFGPLARRARGLAANRVARAEERSALATKLGVAGMFFVLGLIVAVTVLLRRVVIRPVVAVADAAGRVEAGDLTTSVPEGGEDELGALARSFNTMTRSLQDGRQELAERTAELERSNRDLADYASVASHDLQGPLITISMYADVLRRRLVEAESVDAELAGHIGEAAGRLRLLVRDLLSYSRVGHGEMRWEPIELGRLLGQVVEDLAGPIEARGARVECEELPPVVGDRQRLRQLLQNLVGNAVKFSAEAPLVEVTATSADDRVQVTVRDHGVGFDPAHGSEIFRPFSRLQEASGTEGSGIGLAICERIVQRHGGRIWVESSPGQGSAFHFTLMASPGEPPLPPVPAPSRSTAAA